MKKMQDFEWVLSFATEEYLATEDECERLRAAWESFCLQYDLEPDTWEYDYFLLSIWKLVHVTSSISPCWGDFYEFDLYMGQNLC